MERVGLERLDELLDWRMRTLREVFALPDDVDASFLLDLRVANERYYREHLADGTHVACFAVDAGSARVVGCGGICFQSEMPSPDNPSGTNGYLMNIFVIPEMRGRGVGRAIVEHLIACARERGAGKVYLESSEEAKRLYRSLGFEDLQGYMKLA